jgi:hypothetical protein
VLTVFSAIPLFYPFRVVIVLFFGIRLSREKENTFPAHWVAGSDAYFIAHLLGRLFPLLLQVMRIDNASLLFCLSFRNA